MIIDNSYLKELIDQVQARDGGIILSVADKPAAVVLTVEKYNELLQNKTMEKTMPLADEVKKTFLVTGGAGYIGAHLARELLEAGHNVVVLDNLSTGKRSNVPEQATFVEGDLADTRLVGELFANISVDAVFHLAASLEVEESVREPEKYFENNVINTAKLLQVMDAAGVKNIIFSSTAAVYGEQQQMPIAETAPLRPNNPYGHTKALDEKLIKYFTSYSGFRAVVFRYFNACGSCFDGGILPTHHTHLIDNVLQVAKSGEGSLQIYGLDYDTADGTCIRDYIHVLDIAAAHIMALKALGSGDAFKVYNIGTGKGLSVKEIVNSTAEIINRIVPMQSAPRRAGDAPVTIADNRKIRHELGFVPKYSDLQTIISTSWEQMSKTTGIAGTGSV